MPRRRDPKREAGLRGAKPLAFYRGLSALKADLDLLYKAWHEAVYYACLPPTRITALRRLAIDEVVADGLPRRLAQAALGREPHQVWREDEYKVVAYTLSELIKIDLTPDAARRLMVRLI